MVILSKLTINGIILFKLYALSRTLIVILIIDEKVDPLQQFEKSRNLEYIRSKYASALAM